jgi:starch-binding outer membrane protein, SusD/RagB family
MLTDELKTTASSTTDLQFYTNSLEATNSGIKSVWARAYNLIYRSNAVIEGVTASGTLTPAVKNQLIGEARFARAFLFFNLVNIYGRIPLPLTTDYTVNTALPRESVQNVYSQIVSDLKEAQALLNPNYMSAANLTTNDRVRPNKFAATALLARVFLY